MDIKFNEKNAYLKPLCEVLNVEMYHPLAGSPVGVEAPENPSIDVGNSEVDKPD